MFEKSTKLSQGCVMVKILQPDLPICLQYQDEFVCCRRSTLQNRHIFGNDLLFPGFGSSLRLLHWHARAWVTAARVRCVVALTSQCSKLKAIKGVPFAPCKDPSKVPKSPILRSFKSIKKKQWLIFYTVLQSAVLVGALLWNEQQTHPADMTQLPNLPQLVCSFNLWFIAYWGFF